MPLDAANHLAAQGWAGAGKPLRAGPNALSRPIVGVQKKTLGGVGKDRDDAFAFWDHVYAVSAQSIKIKLHNDSDTEESAGSSPPPPSQQQQQLDRTSTGLISNRRPTGSQTPASSSTSTSGTSTPVTTSSESSPSSGSRVSVMAAAKKQAARLELYRRFYVGPVIGPDHHHHESEAKPSSSMDAGDSSFAQSQSTDAELPFASTSEASSTMVVDELDEEAEKKAAKAAKKAARETKRQRKEEKKRRKAEKVASKEEGLKKAKKGKRKPQSDETQSEASCTVSESEKAGQKRKRDENEEEAGPSTDTKGKSVSPARKKKRVKLIMPIPRPTIKYSPSRGPCEKKGILRAPALNPSSPKEQGGSDGEKGKRVTFTKTVISHTVARWWEEAGWSDEGI